ncbi:MAG: hypothetical protein P4M08_15130 [Oligoflexia bacterium]|nr:hypothetical protein [Oligoflexia bacterium]
MFDSHFSSFSFYLYGGQLDDNFPRCTSFRRIHQSGDADQLVELLNQGVSKIVVNSLGGDAEEGLKIGKLLFQKGVDIEVNGVCVSSCANYIFTSGRHKILNNGVVGYHGNIKALLTVGRTDAVEDMKKQGLTDNQISSVLAHYQDVAKEESAFLNTVGVSQALFDRTQSRDKGMGDSKTYVMLAPTPATFLRYGIKNVVGDESRNAINNNPVLKEAIASGEPVLID